MKAKDMKIGMRVECVKDCINLGKIFTVTLINFREGTFECEEDSAKHSADYFEPLKMKLKDEQMLDKFTKDMLKPGMLVECRDGGLRKLGYNPYCGDTVLLRENGNFLFLDRFNNDLIHCSDKSHTVLKVYTPNNTKDNFSFDISHHSLIWERPEPKTELTHDQIAEKLGIKPESLIIVANGMKYGYGCWTKE